MKIGTVRAIEAYTKLKTKQLEMEKAEVNLLKRIAEIPGDELDTYFHTCTKIDEEFEERFEEVYKQREELDKKTTNG